ncbi:aminotransferase class V-fold PLP-dependent enzyme [Sphingobium sp. Sx8-8]|uniref:aminotransferase class V-fold PLP-dependent enzyme n=1 Tax=Sphingobium sp. Sx8-8 TaxID=2933617 RepID=UPI001F58C4EE|nr:aminotransferase class V-fold PLP-dependent enzyme [Sphingobium sp. Sx8-8]
MLLPIEHKSRFHVPPGGPYLLAHSAGCLPTQAAATLEQELLDPWRQAGGNAWGSWLRSIDGFRDLLSQLFGGRPSEWTPQSSVSGGIFRYLSGLPAHEGKSVILASQEAFPSVLYALQGLERIGLRLELVEGDPSQLASWSRAGDADVAAVVLMHVHSNSGRLSPIEAITEIAHAAGAAVVVDIAQSGGVVPIEVGRWNADAVAGTSLKWLCGGPGGCFLWTNPKTVGHIEPMERGWFSHADPFEMDPRNFRFAPDARRFWGGTPAIAPYVTAIAGMRTIQSIGIDAIARHNNALKLRLLDAVPGLAARGIENGSQGGTLCLDLGTGSEAALTKAGAALDRRGSVLRLSLAAWNDADDVDLLADALRTIIPD